MAALAAVAALLTASSCSSGDDDASSRSADGAEDGATTEPAGADAGDVPGADVAVPTVSGPVEGGAYDLPFNPLPSRLADEYGYEEHEYLLSGEATTYAPDGELTQDGEWTVTAGEARPYVTRILVRYPSDPDAFDGTVFLEWLNVSAGMDSDPDFGLAHEEMLRQGSAWVGVSAQEAGIEGGAALPIEIPGFEIEALKDWDPERYADLSHPGDAASYDLFSQAAQALRRPDEVGVDVFDGRRAEHVIAMGESQSAARMVTYVDAVHPLARIMDGFLVHSRGASGAPLADGGSVLGDEAATRIRTDLDEPVLQFQTETDLFGILGSHAARQPDTDTVRTWEVAGTAHADQTTLDYGVESGHEWAPDVELDLGTQCASVNDGPQSDVLKAAVHALRAWVVDGEAPPEAPPLEVDETGGADGTGAIARDERGIALGGIRTPAVDAPTTVLTGEAQPDQSVLCLLFGGVSPLGPSTLAELYPTHDDYVEAVTASTEAAVDDGFLLEPDAEAIVAAADDAPVPE